VNNTSSNLFFFCFLICSDSIFETISIIIRLILSNSNCMNNLNKFWSMLCTLAILESMAWLTKSESQTLFNTCLNSSSPSAFWISVQSSFSPSYFTLMLVSCGNASNILGLISNVSKDTCNWMKVCCRTYQLGCASRSKGDILFSINWSYIFLFLLVVSSYSCSYFSISLLY